MTIWEWLWALAILLFLYLWRKEQKIVLVSWRLDEDADREFVQVETGVLGRKYTFYRIGESIFWYNITNDRSLSLMGSWHYQISRYASLKHAELIHVRSLTLRRSDQAWSSE